MNDVFRVSESSDANSAAFSRLAVPIFTRRSTRTTRLFRRVLSTCPLCLPKTSSPDYVHWALLRISRRPASITGHADRLSRTVHRVGLRPAEPGGAPD